MSRTVFQDEKVNAIVDLTSVVKEVADAIRAHAASLEQLTRLLERKGVDRT